MADVYGDSSFLDDTRDQLETDLNALLALMATASTDPLIAVVYNQHNVIVRSLNAVSVDLESYTAIPSGLDDGIITRYAMIWSIRIHTDYQGGITDSQKAIRLMDSIKGYLSTNKNFDITKNWRIDTINVGSNLEQFDESFTVGSEMLVTITFTDSHVQA